MFAFTKVRSAVGPFRKGANGVSGSFNKVFPRSSSQSKEGMTAPSGGESATMTSARDALSSMK